MDSKEMTNKEIIAEILLRDPTGDAKLLAKRNKANLLAILVGLKLSPVTDDGSDLLGGTPEELPTPSVLPTEAPKVESAKPRSPGVVIGNHPVTGNPVYAEI